MKTFPANEAACVVVGSDGVFEMISEAAVASICYQYSETKDAEAASREIVTKAHAAWSKQMIGYIDDITCIVAYLSKSVEQTLS
jgi:serine/threonine protein phosphatase PrpC